MMKLVTWTNFTEGDIQYSRNDLSITADPNSLSSFSRHGFLAIVIIGAVVYYSVAPRNNIR